MLPFFAKKGFLSEFVTAITKLASNPFISDELLLATLIPKGIVCMESALFYYGYSDFTPKIWTIAMPRTVSRAKLDKETFNKAIRAYVEDDKKNLSNLSKYAKEMGLFKKLNALMEVMLND